MSQPASKMSELNTGIKGYLIELKAEIWLREVKGYEVYYNRAPSGHGDLCYWDVDNESHPIPIDVKTYDARMHSQYHGKSQHGVNVLWYHKHSDQFSFNPEDFFDVIGRERSTRSLNRWV